MKTNNVSRGGCLDHRGNFPENEPRWSGFHYITTDPEMYAPHGNKWAMCGSESSSSGRDHWYGSASCLLSQCILYRNCCETATTPMENLL